ncbi:MAG: hypothetical protein AB7G80_09620 [Dongiaceae bacterium]
MNFFYNLRYTALYMGVLIGLLIAFKEYPLLIQVSSGVLFTPWTIISGLVYVLRDFSQREIGHWVWIPMLIGVLISWYFSPQYGAAVIIGGLFGAFSDWMVYTFTKKPFHERILLSAIASGPMDTIGFFLSFDLLQVMPGVSIFNWPTVIIGSLSKILAGFALYFYYKKRMLYESGVQN